MSSISKKIMWIVGPLALVGLIVGTLKANKQKKEEMNSQNIVQTVFPVSVSEVTAKSLSDQVSLVGTVQPKNDVMVTSETSGKIVRTNVAVGQYVSAGTVLFHVDDELRQIALRQAEANFEKAQKDSSRYAFLVKEKSVAESNWDGIILQYKLALAQLQQAKRALNDTKIKAPVSGYVNSRVGDVGMMVNNGTVVCNIVDMSGLKVKVNVGESDVVNLRAGETATVFNENLPGDKFYGTIANIAVKGDDAHTYPVEIALGANNHLKAGMFARVEFKHAKSGQSLVIPRNALLGSIRDASVYVAKGDKAELRKVTCGNDVQGMIEILNGLSVGEKVVTTGQNTISNGSKISIVSQ